MSTLAKITSFILFLLTHTTQANTLLPLPNGFIDNDPFLTDTNTQLDWLDVTITTGLTYQQIRDELVIGGNFDGWRFATENDVVQLLANFTNISNPASGTIPGTSDTFYIIPSNLLDPLVEILGSTLDVEYTSTYGTTFDAANGHAEGEYLDYTLGFIFTPDNSDNLNIIELLDDDSTEGVEDYYSIGIDSFDRSSSSLNIGTFLVRDSNVQFVPVPSAFWFLGSGLISLIHFSYKKKAISIT